MKILIIDDIAPNRRLLRAQLEAEGHEISEAVDGFEAMTLLQSGLVDGIVSDAFMPRVDGFQLCRELRASEQWRHLPIIIYTSTYLEPSDKKLAEEVGADLFLLKPAPVDVILRALTSISDARRVSPQVSASATQERDAMAHHNRALVRKLEQRNNELSAQTAALLASEVRLRSIFETEPDGVVVFGPDGVVTEINQAGLEMFGKTSLSEFEGRPMTHLIVLEQWDVFQNALAAGWADRKSTVEFLVAPDRGHRRWIEMHAAPLRDGAGQITAILGILRDNTERKELAEQYVHAQRMEVVGHLAGGIAHDFNNMLGIVMGYSELAMHELSSGTQLYEFIETILHTSERAAALTRQLLIFSRKQAVQPQTLDLTKVLTGLDRMLRRLVGETIALKIVPELELYPVEADPGQIEQVLMNLCVNARDAMPQGGTLTVATSNITVTAESSPLPEMKPGRYGAISVEDEGTGMTEEVKGRMFEAFFTTKPAGKGTGLGLATCQSIVKQWHGYITVESALGRGTAFRVYFPEATREVGASTEAAESGALPRGHELVLLVEDEPGVRNLAATILSRQGYTVLKAANGREALRIVSEVHDRGIDLILSDLVMPEMGGLPMAAWLRSHYPEIKLLLTSGYSDQDGALDSSIEFLPKPYTPQALVRRVRAVLDGPHKAESHERNIACP